MSIKGLFCSFLVVYLVFICSAHSFRLLNLIHVVKLGKGKKEKGSVGCTLSKMELFLPEVA